VATVLILGRTRAVVDDVLARVARDGVRLAGGTGVDDVRAAFAGGRVDHVVMGAGLDLDVRLDIVRAVFATSDATTVHMKDVASGPAGFRPFVEAIVDALG
jgi:hypothetical protein